MGAIRELLSSFSQLFKWWFIVAPWEQALRIRGGKRSKLLCAGVHFRIPFWDRIYRQSVRLRANGMPSQTLSTADDYVLTVRLCIMYQIADMERVYESLEDLDALSALAATAVADYITSHRMDEITPSGIEQAATAALPMSRFGLESPDERSVRVIDVVRLKKTYRLITGDISRDGYWDEANFKSHVGQREY